jgi:hypothetical protein
MSHNTVRDSPSTPLPQGILTRELSDLPTWALVRRFEFCEPAGACHDQFSDCPTCRFPRPLPVDDRYSRYILMFGAAAFDVAKFSINTNIQGLISQNFPWHQRQVELSEAFPQRAISVVVKAPTAENADLAANQLARSLSKNPNLFPRVGQPDTRAMIGNSLRKTFVPFDTDVRAPRYYGNA